MFAKTYGASLRALEASLVEVEIDLAWGLPGIHLVGLPDLAIQEAKERVRSAIKNSGFQFPSQRLTINMAPAHTRKSGPLDLAIGLGILLASEQVRACDCEDWVFLGELSLNGEVRPIRGALALALAAVEAGKKYLVLPRENASEAALVKGIQIYPVSHFREVCEMERLTPWSVSSNLKSSPDSTFDFADLKGQAYAKRAAEIAAAGGHHLMLIGPPGSGKTMLAQRLPSILPPLSEHESLQASRIHSISGRSLKNGLLHERPFRAPHHTITPAALVGGSQLPQPGEISLAHHGVLFLDELLEFKRPVLELLRQPLEDGFIQLARAQGTVTYPSSFMLVAALNPCPCGFATDSEVICSCSDLQRTRYWNRLSGPLLDRIDLYVEMPRLALLQLSRATSCSSSSEIRKRVNRARERQSERLGIGHTNAQLRAQNVEKTCVCQPEAMRFLELACQKLHLSARAWHQSLKIARTIADLDQSEAIESAHVAEAVQYRTLPAMSGTGLYR